MASTGESLSKELWGVFICTRWARCAQSWPLFVDEIYVTFCTSVNFSWLWIVCPGETYGRGFCKHFVGGVSYAIACLRFEDAVTVIDGIVSTFGKQAAANPNLLEYHGHVLLQRKEGVQPTSAEFSSPSAETSGRDATRGGHDSASVLPLSSSESSCLNPSQATAAIDLTTAVGGSSISSQTEDPHLPPLIGLDSIASSSAPSGTSATPVTGGAFSAAVNAAKAAPRCGCSGRAVVSSIAVNRVQSTYSTPVYASQGGSIGNLDRRLRPRCRPLSSGATVGKGDGAVGERERHSEEGAQDDKAENDAAREDGGGGLDGQAYRRRVFNSVHVGELWFEGDRATEGNGGATATDMTARHGSQAITGSTNNKTSRKTEQLHSPGNILTVLLPVRNGGDQLIDAVESVFSCAREMPSGWGVDLLIVDDGSEDSAVEQAVAAVTHTDPAVAYRGKDLGENRGQTSLGGVPRNMRCTEAEDCVVASSGSAAGDPTAGGGDVIASSRVAPHGVGDGPCTTLSEARRSESGVTIRVLRHEWSLGLAESLNEGLREARGDLVARMDADDVCIPGRLKQQVR